MDDAGYKKKYGEPQTLEELLMYAAFISGQGGLEHRTLHHFGYFVSSLIFGKTEYDRAMLKLKTMDKDTLSYRVVEGAATDSLKIYNKYNSLYEACQGSPLLKYAKAFVQYCGEEYSGDNLI